MLCFDIGANRGDFTKAALDNGYKVIAVEAAPRVFSELVKNFIYSRKVIPLKFAVSDSDYERIEFYEAYEDGLSTLNKAWLTDDSLPYAGKPYRTTACTTITIDTLVKLYGTPSLIKIDVEGAEWVVLKGMSKAYGELTLEWTIETIEQHKAQIEYLKELGYTKIAPQFIEHHLQRPKTYYPIDQFDFENWQEVQSLNWTGGGWRGSNLRPTADVGMLWFS